MNEPSGLARRYHWLRDAVIQFAVEPHQAVVGQREPVVMDLTNRSNLSVQAVRCLWPRRRLRRF